MSDFYACSVCYGCSIVELFQKEGIIRPIWYSHHISRHWTQSRVDSSLLPQDPDHKDNTRWQLRFQLNNLQHLHLHHIQLLLHRAYPLMEEKDDSDPELLGHCVTLFSWFRGCELLDAKRLSSIFGGQHMQRIQDERNPSYWVSEEVAVEVQWGKELEAPDRSHATRLYLDQGELGHILLE